jgi:hypothetical protein
MSKRTRFSFEVPVAHLEDFDDLQDFIFLLSMLLHPPNPLYIDYLHKKVKEGLLPLWLDNSFNERFEADTPETLKILMDIFPINRVIAPDSIYWSPEQMQESYTSMINLGLFPDQLIVAVRDLEVYQALSLVGAKHFAISYWVRAKWSYRELAAVPSIHFLGCLDLKELQAVKPTSCDTGMPIKLAMQGKTIAQWIEEDCPHINNKDLGEFGVSYFDAELDSDTISLARRNILALRREVNGPI